MDSLKRFLCAWKHNKEKISGVVKITKAGFTPIEGSKWEDLDISNVLSELQKMGMIKVNSIESVLKCPSCNNTTFYVIPVCSECGAPLEHRSREDLFDRQGEETQPDNPLFNTLKLQGSKTVSEDEEINLDAAQPSADEWKCNSCGSPVLKLEYMYRCSKCGYEIRDKETLSYRTEKIYSIDDEKVGYYTGYIDSIISIFEDMGYKVECLGQIIGKSGTSHTFDLIAKRQDQIISVAIEVGSWILSERQAVEYHLRAYDTLNSALHMLITIPSISEEVKKIILRESVDLIEASDAQSALDILRSRLEAINENVKNSTGITGLDKMTGGGLLEKKVYLVIGEAGIGKTVFGLQFLIHGTRNGIPGIFITTTQQPQEIIETAESLELGIKKYIDDGTFTILDLTHQFEEIKSKGIEDTWKYKSFITKLVSDISKQVKKAQAGRMVIDTVTPFLPVEGYDYAKSLIEALSQLNCTIVLTKESSAKEIYESNFVSGVIRLSQELVDEKLVRRLYITKLRYSNYDTSPHIFRIEKGKGIIVD